MEEEGKLSSSMASQVLREMQAIKAQLQSLPSAFLIRTIIREELEDVGHNGSKWGSEKPEKEAAQVVHANTDGSIPISQPSREDHTKTDPEADELEFGVSSSMCPLPHLAEAEELHNGNLIRQTGNGNGQAGDSTTHPNKIVIHNVEARDFRKEEEEVELERERISIPANSVGRADKIKLNVFNVVQSTAFDYGSAFFVLVNAITIGMQTDHMAQGLLESPSAAYRIVDLLFCLIFSSELILRLVAHGRTFFVSSDWKWNWFDFVLVANMLFDEVISMIAFGGISLSGEKTGTNFSFLRILRILRLVKIMRVIRVLRLVSELRTIVSSILGSMKALLWTVVLLFLLVYVFAVFFTQMVLEYRVSRIDLEEQEFDSELTYYFGTLARSIFSLYQAITSGVDWDALANPLMQRIHVLLGLLLVCYTAFALLALMNVVTGVFVEAALESAKKDRSSYMLRHTRELFAIVDPGNQGELDWDHFQAALENKEMQEFFQSIEVDIADAESVFNLLDVDDGGSIDLDEFLNGCLGLHGPAKAIHQAALMYELRVNSKTTQSQVDSIHSFLEKMAQEMKLDGMDSWLQHESADGAHHVNLRGRGWEAVRRDGGSDGKRVSDSPTHSQQLRRSRKRQSRSYRKGVTDASQIGAVKSTENGGSSIPVGPMKSDGSSMSYNGENVIQVRPAATAENAESKISQDNWVSPLPGEPASW